MSDPQAIRVDPMAPPTDAFSWAGTSRTVRRVQGSVDAMESELRSRLRGEVRFDHGSRALYATDASNYRQVPLGVVVPRDVEDLVEAVAVCHRFRAPIVHRGAATSLAGQTANAAVVIDNSKYVDRILEIDLERRLARVQPGVRHDQLTDITEKHHLTFGPDTSTHKVATFGGMIGNNSCGVHSLNAGRTAENILEMEVLTYDGVRMRVGPTSDEELENIVRRGGRQGEIYRRMRDLRDRYEDRIRARYPRIPRRVSGYNLDELLPENGFNVARALVGSEGTLATILEATVRLVPSPPRRSLLVIGYEDVFLAGDDVARLRTFRPEALEGMDDVLIAYMKRKGLHLDHLTLLPDGGGFLLVEFGGDTQEEADEKAHVAAEAARALTNSGVTGLRVVTPEEQPFIWEVREAGLGATAHEAGETWPGWEDSAVPPERIGDYMRELRGLLEQHGYEAALYGHFGQGCVHCRISFDLVSRPGVQQFRHFLYEATDLCVRYGGSLTAEHGDGQARAEMLPRMFGEELCTAFREFKEIWDPDWLMNPGKVVDPYRVDDNLRLGPSYEPPQLDTWFAFPDDDRSFAKAAERCVGVGKCRRMDFTSDAVMCPSFVATKEEMHSTRGRARLLFEMLNGEETPGAWQNEAVFEALDLCLSCKGCKNDCPVSVDMATYKAEFLAHYYEGRLRPRHAYAFGLIYWWARIASRAPGLANFFSQSPGFARIARGVAGIAPQRRIPRFAPVTFRTWFASRSPRQTGGPRVVLWPDTFNNFFYPETAAAAVEVLERAGFEVTVPEQMLCCGRPLYDYGMLGQARKMWHEILHGLRDEIRSGTPIVGLEPSCVAAFRDELVNMLPDDRDAGRLRKQTFTLAEFIDSHSERFDLPPLQATALVHGHCHHKSIMGFDADRRVLERAGLTFEVVPAGCCGMAGAFGFEAEHYDVSMKSGEHALLPRVREAGKEVLIVADGFSCREQIAQATDRQPLHLAQVLHLGMRGTSRVEYPERRYLQETRLDRPARPQARSVRVALGVAAVAALAGLLAKRIPKT